MDVRFWRATKETPYFLCMSENRRIDMHNENATFETHEIQCDD